jgi:Putative zinc- or iron-chelating domain
MISPVVLWRPRARLPRTATNCLNGMTNLTDPSSARTTDTAPCVGCGLCCDGTIYWRATAEAGEKQRLMDAGLEVSNEGEKYWFAHPCRFAKDGLCTIYDQERFSVCHTYRCKLLKAYQSGEVTRDEALGTVQQALALRRALVHEEPAAALSTERQKLRRDLKFMKERPQLHLRIAALDSLLDRWFRA